jgi:hypothetical protein
VVSNTVSPAIVGLPEASAATSVRESDADLHSDHRSHPEFGLAIADSGLAKGSHFGQRASGSLEYHHSHHRTRALAQAHL